MVVFRASRQEAPEYREVCNMLVLATLLHEALHVTDLSAQGGTVREAAQRHYGSPKLNATTSSLPSFGFWVTVTIFISAVSALLGVFLWQLVFGLSTGNWVIPAPVSVWGSLLSLGLFFTIAARVRYRPAFRQ